MSEERNFPGSPEFSGFEEDGPEQMSLEDLGLEVPELDWEAEWKGMPEFKRFDAAPHQRVIVNILTKKDVEKFSELIGQKIGPKTVSIWFPEFKTPTGVFVDEKDDFIGEGESDEETD